jgi:uncharacterized membrane protein
LIKASFKSSWYWPLISITVLAAISIFMIPQNEYPWAYIRNILGLMLVLFLPGYSSTKMFFPTKIFPKTPSKRFDIIEQVSISIGLSIAITSSSGIVMYFTPIGIDLIPITLILLSLTVIFATIAETREILQKNKLSDKTVKEGN